MKKLKTSMMGISLALCLSLTTSCKDRTSENSGDSGSATEEGYGSDTGSETGQVVLTLLR